MRRIRPPQEAATGRWQHVRTSRRWREVPGQVLVIVAGVVLYFGVRGLTNSDPGRAMDHARDIVSLERRLGIYVEPRFQDLVDDSHGLTTFVNWIYIWGHWPVIIATLLWLVLEHPVGYRITRNAMLSSGAIGLVVFATYPVAPPRLVPLGLIDTVTDYSHAYRVLQPAAFVNQYAAMPSLHVGWDLLIGIALFTYSTHLVIRAIGVLLPALMAFSVLATANHFLLDAVVGVSLVLVCLAGARRWERRRAARRRARGRPAERIPVVPRARQLPAVPAQVVPAEAAPAEAAPAGAPHEEGRGDVVPQPRPGGSGTPAALSCSPGERCDD